MAPGIPARVGLLARPGTRGVGEVGSAAYQVEEISPQTKTSAQQRRKGDHQADFKDVGYDAPIEGERQAGDKHENGRHALCKAPRRWGGVDLGDSLPAADRQVVEALEGVQCRDRD